MLPPSIAMSARGMRHLRKVLLVLTLVSGLPLLLLAGFGLVFYHHRARLAQATEGWPTVQGVVTSSSLRQGGYKVPRLILAISYRYAVNGRSYDSDRVSYGTIADNDNWNYQYYNEHPPGTAVPVYYDPESPEDAILVRGAGPGFTLTNRSFGAMLFISIIILFIGLALILFVGSRIKMAEARLAWRGSA